MGRFLGEMAALGVTTPALEPTFCATPRHGTDAAAPGLRRITSERPVEQGELVAVDAGALYAGYEGGVGRTWECTGPGGRGGGAGEALRDRWRSVMDAMVRRAEPGAPAAALRDAYADAGEPVAALPAAYGLGLGMEPPIVHGAGDAPLPGEALEPGMVLALQAYVWAEGAGGWFGRQAVLVGDAGPEVLTRIP